MNKIAIVFSHLPPEAQYSWVLMARHLKKNRIFDLKIFIHADRKVEDYLLLKERNSLLRKSKFIYYLLTNEKNKRQKSLFWQLYEFKPELVHFINSQNIPELEKLVISMGARFVSTFRGYDLLVRPHKDHDWKIYLNKIFQNASGLHFVSDYIHKNAVEQGAPSAICKTIYQGVDLVFFKKTANVSNSEFSKLISVGRLTWEKGFIYALEAVNILTNKGIKIKYEIFGEGADRSVLQYHIRRLNLENTVFLKGYQPKEIIRLHLEQSHIYVHPSLSDALPNSILEASSLELPIIGSNVGGIPECVMHEETGLLCDPAQVRPLSENIEILILDRKKAIQMGINGRRLMVEKFNLNQEFEEWEKFYKKSLNT